MIHFNIYATGCVGDPYGDLEVNFGRVPLSLSSQNKLIADLAARIIHLADHPEASLIFREHEGYRFIDPVEEMLFKVGR